MHTFQSCVAYLPIIWLKLISLAYFRLEGLNTVDMCWNMASYPVVYHPKGATYLSLCYASFSPHLPFEPYQDLGGFFCSSGYSVLLLLWRLFVICCQFLWSKYCLTCWPHFTHRIPPTQLWWYHIDNTEQCTAGVTKGSRHTCVQSQVGE